MKRVRSIVNIVLGALVTMLGITGCEQRVKYGVPIEKYGCPIDTTMHCMYGVEPVIWDEMPQDADE